MRRPSAPKSAIWAHSSASVIPTSLPQLGAARDYYTNETWQSAITRWIEMAQLIIKIAGPTAAVRWELRNILELKAMERLVMLFPPGTYEDRLTRWRNIARCLEGSDWQAAASSVDPNRLTGLGFLKDGCIFAVYGGLDRTLDYTLALRILLTPKPICRAERAFKVTL